MRTRNEIDSYADWCVHYCGLGGSKNYSPVTGFAEARCDAGVRYRDVRQDRPGAQDNLDRLPCFKRNGLPCPKQRFNTPEEAAALRAKDDASVKKYIENLANDICPICEAPVAKKHQVGRCVYAEPCGHRLYQGQLPETSDEEYEMGSLW